MSNYSTRAYVHIGATVLGLLGIILPINSVLGFGFNIFDTFTGLGVTLYFISVVLMGVGAFFAIQGKDSKIFGILGGVGMIFMVIMNYSYIADLNTWWEVAEPAFGHWVMILAAIISVVGGFLKDPEME